MSPFASLALSVVAILLCGGLGALVGYSLVEAAGWSGPLPAILAVFAAMVVATLAFGGGIALLRKLRWLH